MYRFFLRLIHVLTALAALAGVWGLWRMGRGPTPPVEGSQGGAPQILGVLARLGAESWIDWVATSLLHPVVWGSLLVAWIAAVVARRLEPGWVEPTDGRRVHRVGSVDRGAGNGDGSGTGRTPAAGDPAGGRETSPMQSPLQSPRHASVTDAARRRRRRGERRLRMEAFLRGDADVRAFADEMLAAAIEEGASDVHVEPGTPYGRVRFRVRGELRDVAKVPAAHHRDLMRRLKVMSRLVPYEEDPQDGRLSVEAGEGKAARRVDVRVSVVPTGEGQKAVLRLAGDASLRDLERLGLGERDRERLVSLLAEPQGLVLVTGPTGSGKTTTLYSALGEIHRGRPGASLVSIEEPIEVEIPFVAQTQVDRARDLGFAAALRTVLRQDPDVMMVGEIRDPETAKIAVQAGLSGHLVLSTLHAGSAVGIFPRLIDLGVEPFLAASSTLAAISQRLLPRLCESCRRPRSPTGREEKRLRAAGLSAAVEDKTFYVAEGCAACDYRGIEGRIAVFEILRLGSALRKKIAAKAPTPELQRAAREAGLVPLEAAALEAAARGDVSLGAALSVITEERAVAAGRAGGG